MKNSMQNSIPNSLKPILESIQGPHLTAYVRNDATLPVFKDRLKRLITTAEARLSREMGEAERERFLQPLRSLREDGTRIRGLGRNVALFRNGNLFRIMSLPVEVQPLCIVSDSFHVKPLLRWLQSERDFLLLALDAKSASLYRGNQTGFHLIDTVLFSKPLHWLTEEGQGRTVNMQERASLTREAVEWVDSWIATEAREGSPPLFVAGEARLAQAFIRDLSYPHLDQDPVWAPLTRRNEAETCAGIRALLRANARREYERSMIEFHFASDQRTAKNSLFRIAQAASKGWVRRLLIAEDLKLTGQLDRDNGNIRLHAADLNRMEDDLLDDLAQLVLSRGGEVVVAPSGEMPRGKIALALLDERSAS